MTLVTLLPSSTVSNTGGSIVGAATVHQAWNDASDATYVEYANNENSRVHLDDITLPAGAAFVSASAVARVGAPSRATRAEAYAISGTLKATSPYQFTASTSTPATVPVGADSSTVVWTDPIIDAMQFQVGKPDASINGALLRVYRAYLEVRYATVPSPTVTAPTGTLTDTNLPTIEWTPGLDTDGGPLVRTEVRIFSAAQYGAGGFNPATSTPTAARTTTDNADLSWQTPIALANATYRAYVRVSQIVKGAYLQSAWVFGGFIINNTPPGAPTVTAVANNATGAIVVTVTAPGGLSTDAYEVERSRDAGVTWVVVRNATALGGIILGAGGVVTDYEAPNGVTVLYRARALHNYSGTYGAGAWTTAASTSWTSLAWWLKHPNLPALNLVVLPISYREVKRASRHGVFQPLGATVPVVVSDTRAGAAGPLVLRTDTAAARDLLDALLAVTDTLLLQPPATAGEPDRYVRFGDTSSARLVDNQAFHRRDLTVEWLEVGQPIGPTT